MNKEWKIRLLIFIISGIIFTRVGIFAKTKIIADKITYTADITVKDKIDSLYEMHIALVVILLLEHLTQKY